MGQPKSAVKSWSATTLGVNEEGFWPLSVSPESRSGVIDRWLALASVRQINSRWYMSGQIHAVVQQSHHAAPTRRSG